MPYVNIKVTREGVTTEQKELSIRETTAMLERVLYDLSPRIRLRTERKLQ